MAKVSLRVYNREIESMIEGGQLDEAVAHCQHILKTFPMHIETYRLLGKGFLEARLYTDAADIFQRTLMAVPDDFVSHVGMSIIRDDEGKLDDAIWHMERAFEDQPSNPAIQSELRHLYGRRDGVEPSKIRLSRDALANMYSQGELFNQAIAEIRAVLAEDANRSDLQVMLGRAYYRAGQKVEAAEMAANLLKKYPYCVDALRILVDVLPGTARTNNTQAYRQRLCMLDPYAAFATGSVFNTDKVADNAVNLERLEYTAGAFPTAPQPNWTSSLGIKLKDENRAEPAPEAMTSADPRGQVPPPASRSSGPASESNPKDESVPEWMRTAGWQESSGNTQNGRADLNPNKPEESIAEADIPEWLKSMAPRDFTEANTGSEPIPPRIPSSGDEDASDWLAGLGTAKVDPKLEPSSSETNPEDDGAFPEWLKETSEGVSAGAAASFSAQPKVQPQPEEETIAGQATPPTPATQAPVDSPIPAARTDEETPIKPTGETMPLNIEEDAMAWLEGLAAKQGAKEEELLTKPANHSEDRPDWLQPANDLSSAPTSPEPTPAPPEAIPLEALSPQIGEGTAQENTLAEELPTHPENLSDDMPEWLRGINEQPSASASPEAASAMSEPLPFEALSPHAGEFAAQETTPAEELPTQAEKLSDDMPEWLRGVSEQPSTAASPGASSATAEPPHIEAFSPQVGDFAAQENAPVEELPTQPENLSDDVQEWSRSVDEETTASALPEASLATAESVPLDALTPLVGEGAVQENTPAEGLPTQPENVSDEMPAWLRSVSEKPSIPENLEPSPMVKESLTDESQAPFAGETATQETVPAEELPTSIAPVEEATQPVKPVDDTMAWLEGLVAEQQAKPEESPNKSDESLETPPDWIKEEEQEPVAQVNGLTPETQPEKGEDDLTITSWLSKKDVEEALRKKNQPDTDTSQQPPVGPSTDLPDWLKDLEKPVKQEEALKPAEDLPDWLRQPVKPADQGVEAVLSPEVTIEAETPTWVDDNKPASEPPVPTTPEEWVPMDEKPASSADSKPIAKAESLVVETPGQPRVLGGTGMLSQIPNLDKDAEILVSAQAALNLNQAKEAMQAYTKLIKKNRLLDEVIHDLREAIYRFPVDINVWQTLGDASMRANHLQDALDAYTKAEELLR